MKKWLLQHRVEIGLYLCFTALSLFVLKGGRIPSVFPEEAGYLGWANQILYGKGSGFYFLPGYSLLLLPLMAVSNQIPVIYPWLLVENVLINGFFIVGLYRLAGLWGLSGKKQIVTAAVISLYAPFVLYTQKVICETLLIVCGLWLTVCMDQALGQEKKSGIFGAAALGAVLLATHSRELVLIPVLLILLFVCYQKKKAVRIGAIAIMVLGLICGGFVLMDDGVSALHLKGQLAGLFSFRGLGRLGLTFLSQSCYWILGTFGLAPAGLWYGIRLVKQRERGWQAALFALLFFAATAVLSALYMSHQQQAIHLIYGRYNDGALGGILILGAIAYLQKRPPWQLWAVCAGDVLITAALYGEKLAQLPKMMINACGLFFSWAFLWRWDIWAVLIVCTLMAFLLWRLLKNKRTPGLLLLGGFFLFQLVFTAKNFLTHQNTQPPKLVQVFNRLEPEDWVLYSRQDYVRSFFYYSVYCPGLLLSEEDRILQEEGDVEISTAWQENRALLGAENGTFLWARDEKTAEKYKDLILPEDGHVERPQSEIRLLECKEKEMKILVENTGSPWLCLSAIGDVQKAVRLGIRMFDAEGALIEERRADFSKNMLSGDCQEFTVSLPSEAEVISFELVQEFQNWFSQLGDEGALTVNRRGEAAAYPDADHGFHTLYPEFLIAKQESDTLPDKNNLEGFYGSWTGAESSFCHLNISCEGKKELIVKEGEEYKENPTLNIILNDSIVLSNPVYRQGEYVFSLRGFEGTVQKITLQCNPYNPFRESGWPECFSFLSLDSHLRPVQFLVHRIRNQLGVDVNNHDFGIDVKKIVIR